MPRSVSPTAEQAATILAIDEAGERGVKGAEIHGTVRATLLRRGWATATVAGEHVNHREWTATYRATPAGVAAARQVAARPVQLGAYEALALALIQQSGPGGFLGYRPGERARWRVIERWQLVEFAPRRGGWNTYGLYRLTEAGTAALERWRASLVRPEVPEPAHARVLAAVKHHGRPPARCGPGTVEACQVFGWLTRPAFQGGQLTVTEAGERALAQAGLPPRQRPVTPAPVLVRELRAGQRIRMAHRRGWRNLGPGWEVFRRAERVPAPGGWLVYVEDGRGGERLYVDTPVGFQTRFQVQ